MGSKDCRERVYREYRRNLAPELTSGSVDLGARDALWAGYYLPRLPADKDAAILDLGCGGGELLDFLRRRGYRRLEGVDGSPSQAAAARARGLAVEHGDLFEFLKARPGRWDAIVAVDVLEHLDKDEVLRLADLVLAALKPGGAFVAQTVNAESPGWGRQLHADLTHEQAFTRYSLSQLFAVAGFSSSEFAPARPGGGLRQRALWRLTELVLGLYAHAETGSGMRRHGRLFTPTLLAVARR